MIIIFKIKPFYLLFFLSFDKFGTFLSSHSCFSLTGKIIFGSFGGPIGSFGYLFIVINLYSFKFSIFSCFIFSFDNCSSSSSSLSFFIFLGRFIFLSSNFSFLSNISFNFSSSFFFIFLIFLL